MKHKKLFITFTVIFSVLLALAIFIMIWFWGDRYDDFKDFRSEVAISGLKDGACPQGITVYQADTVKEKNENGEEVEVVTQQNYFFITAYFKNQASRIYVVGDKTGEVGYVTLKNPAKDGEEGTDHTGHVGGIATNGNYLWVCSGKTIYVAKEGTTTKDCIAVKLIKEAKKNGSIQFTTSFNANCNAAFLYYYDADDKAPTTPNTSYDYLYVGEFYRAGNYETDELHHLTTPNGETNRAFAYEYKVSTSTDFGLTTISEKEVQDANGNKVPRIYSIFSLPNEIQGFARTKNGLVLSASYGLKNSHIYYYDFAWAESGSTHADKETRVKYTDIGKKDDPGQNADKNPAYIGGFAYDGAKTVNDAQYYGKDMNVYYIDSSSMLNDYSIPSMSEGLCTLNGRVYVLFESGAKKYSTFVRQVLTNVYSFIPRSKH